MVTNALKKFAQEARTGLLKTVTFKIDYALSEDSPARRETPKAVQELEVVSEDEHVVDQSTESTPQDESVVNETEAQSQEEEESYETVATRISERESEIVKMQKANVRDHKLLARLHNKAVRDARKNRRNKNREDQVPGPLPCPSTREEQNSIGENS